MVQIHKNPACKFLKGDCCLTLTGQLSQICDISVHLRETIDTNL